MARKGGGGKKVVVTGVKEIDRKLKKLESTVAKRVVRAAMRASLKPVAAAVKAEAPVLSGQLRRAVKVRAGRSTKGRITMEVRIGEGDFVGAEYYAAFQEFGWKPGKRGTPRGKPVEGKHFMEKAFKRTGAAAKDECVRLILEGADAAIKAGG